jgi:hypothetical protein
MGGESERGDVGGNGVGVDTLHDLGAAKERQEVK